MCLRTLQIKRVGPCCSVGCGPIRIRVCTGVSGSGRVLFCRGPQVSQAAMAHVGKARTNPHPCRLCVSGLQGAASTTLLEGTWSITLPTHWTCSVSICSDDCTDSVSMRNVRFRVSDSWGAQPTRLETRTKESMHVCECALLNIVCIMNVTAGK